MPAKASPQEVAGQYSYGGLQTISQAAPLPGNYQGSGQTVRPHMGPSPVAHPPNNASAPRSQPPLLNSYGSPTTVGGSVSHARQLTPSNWQYFPTPLSHAQSLANHAPSTTGMAPGPLVGNSKPPTNQQYGHPFGGPPLQNSFMNPGNTVI